MQQMDKDFFRQACNNIMACPKANGYAKAYAKAGLDLSNADDIKTQALYILSNITAWRGETACATRVALKKIGAL